MFKTAFDAFMLILQSHSNYVHYAHVVYILLSVVYQENSPLLLLETIHVQRFLSVLPFYSTFHLLLPTSHSFINQVRFYTTILYVHFGIVCSLNLEYA